MQASTNNPATRYQTRNALLEKTNAPAMPIKKASQARLQRNGLGNS
jgi:hypothetical protein